MKNKAIYTGDSEGFKSLSDGYMEYALETIQNRAIPDIRDGLKPVIRRTLFAMQEHKYTKMTPSLKVVGDISHYHPHGDASIYESFCRLTDKAGNLNTPLLIGNGSFSKVYLEDKPADKRYTNVMLAPLAQEFFKEPLGIEMVLDEKGEGLEPAVLPVTFPFILVSGSSGMAVSLSTDIPPFNFWDVLDLMEKLLYKEELNEEDIIIPDYPTGGYIVNNRKEFLNIMVTGKGKIKVRADVQINGKEINIIDVPFGRLVGGMVRKLKKAEIPGISSIYESTDYKSELEGNKITVTCTSKSKVEEVLMHLYRLGIAHKTVSANVKTILGDEPVFGGVFTIMRRWLAWRESVIKSVQEKKLKSLYVTQSELSYFIKLVNDIPNRDKFIDLMVNYSTEESRVFLKELFPKINDTEVDFILERRLSQFNKGGKYQEKLSAVNSQIEACLDILNNPKKQIQEDINRLRRENKGKYERKTRITEKDYKFSKIENSEIEDNSPCYYSITDKAVTKLPITHNPEMYDNVIEANANSVLVGFDSMGRCVRVYGSDLSFGRVCNLGEYLGITGAVDFKVPYLSLEDEKPVMLLYSDGYCSFFNPEEIKSGSRKALIIKQGVPLEVKDKLVKIIPFSEIAGKDYLAIREGEGIGVIPLENVRIKGRQYRTLIGDTEITKDNIFLYTSEEVCEMFPKLFERLNKIKEEKSNVND